MWWQHIPPDVRIYTYTFLAVNSFIYFDSVVFSNKSMLLAFRHQQDLKIYIRMIRSFACVASLCWVLKRKPFNECLIDSALLAPAFNASGSFKLPILLHIRSRSNRTYYRYTPPLPSTAINSTANTKEAALRLFHWAVLTNSTSTNKSGRGAASTLPVAEEVLRRRLVNIDSYYSYGYYGSRTALIHAAAEGNAACVLVLLQARPAASPFKCDAFGRTPLHFACYNNSLSHSGDARLIVQALLQAGASVHCTDSFNKSPLQLAEQSKEGHGVIYRMLLAHDQQAWAGEGAGIRSNATHCKTISDTDSS